MMVNLVLTAASLCFPRMPFGMPTGIERVQARARRRRDRSEAGANRGGRRGGSAPVMAQGAAVSSAGAVRNRCSSRSRFASFRLSSCQASTGPTRYFRFSNAYTDIVRCFPRALEASLTDD